MKKRALILGIGGQDGSFMAEILLSKGYEVHGMYRRSSVDNLSRIKQIKNLLVLHKGDLCDGGSIHKIVSEIKPDELYNLADQDDVRWSAEIPAYSLDVTVGAVGRLLESIRLVSPQTKVFQPVSCTMFGDALPPQNETTPLDPQSPYACAKAHAYHLARHYRRNRGLFVTVGIMFNHDSPGRSEGYFYQRICREAVEVLQERCTSISIGNPKTRFDVGYAKDYMTTVYALMQLDTSTDVVIGSGISPTVKEVVEYSLFCAETRARIETDPDGPLSPHYQADCRKVISLLGFAPSQVTWQTLVEMLVKHYQERV